MIHICVCFVSNGGNGRRYAANSPVKRKQTMNTNNNNETNTNTTPDAADAVNPSTHGGLTADAVLNAEGIENKAAPVARIRRGEIATNTKVVADGWGAAFKYLAAFERAPNWFNGASRFAFRSGDTRARRLTGEGEDAKGHAVIVNYVPTVRVMRTDEKGQKVTEWHETAHLLANVGICVPSRVNLALAKKIQSVFNRIFCSGHSPADVLGKKMSDKEKAQKAQEERDYWKAEAERLAKAAEKKA
jgi:hypothetical protein